MKLHTKLSLMILSGLVLIVVIAQIFQYLQSSKLISALSSDTLALLKEREEQAVRNIFRSVERAVSGSLERGEMEKFTRLLEAQHEVEGLLEFSLYDRNGIVTHSSDPSFLKKTLPADLQARLLTDPEQLFRHANGAIEVYQPQIVVADCIRCHKTWENGAVCGVTSMRFSKQALLQAEQRTTEAMQSAERSFLINSVLTLFGVVGVFMLLMFFSVNTFVRRPLDWIIAELQELTRGEGDLTKRLELKTNDELGAVARLFNLFLDSLQTMVRQIQHSGMQVTSSSTELAATAKQQEVTMQTQMESTTRVVQAIQEISGMIADLTHTMQQVAAMSAETAEFAGHGQADLTRMDGAMQHMEQASRAISGKLQAIHEKTENITTVVTTISKVADQTNLLSLNAAIEAEKAGEFGRGFTVVAREIRRLADQTALATLDIEQMVKEMQSAVSAGVMEMDKFIAEVRHSADDVEKIGGQLTRIIDRVQAVLPQFEDVNVAMSQQSDHASQINTAMTDLGEEMQQTTEALQESFSAIEQLNDAARGLQQEVSRFKVN